MSITDHIEKVRSALRAGVFTSEATVSQGIVLPTLNELGWPIFDTGVVTPEFSVEGRRVDFALFHPATRPAVFIEVKKIGSSDGADRQLFEYAFLLGVPVAILTDGQEWSFYLPAEQGPYDERRVYKLDLLERDVAESASRLERYLNYQKTCSGEALRAARADYQNVARDREIEATLDRAWAALLDEKDSLLLELLAGKVEDLCGYKADLDLCSKFLAGIAKNMAPKPVPPRGPTAPPPTRPPRRTRESDRFAFTFDRKQYNARSARDVMVQVFQLIAAKDDTFLERYASRKHGKKRRYLAREKLELYPGRPDLAEEYSVEVVPGWWLGTNYSRGNIQQIIDLALELLPSHLRAATKVNVERTPNNHMQADGASRRR